MSMQNADKRGNLIIKSFKITKEFDDILLLKMLEKMSEEKKKTTFTQFVLEALSAHYLSSNS